MTCHAKEITVNNPLTKIYVTKYALTRGLFSVMAGINSEGKYACWRSGKDTGDAYGKDFWLTKEEALADCERRRNAKLASIEKQAKKLKAITFTIED